MAGDLLICLCSRLLLCLRIPLFFSVVFHLIVILWWSEGGDCLVGRSKRPPSLAPLEKYPAASFCTLDGSSSVFTPPHSSPNFQPLSGQPTNEWFTTKEHLHMALAHPYIELSDNASDI